MKSWKDSIRKNINNIENLSSDINVSDSELSKLEEVTSRHPMNIPEYYYNLIDWDNPNDPIRKLSVPHVSELDTDGDYDTSGESTNTKMAGLQHKYNTTALVLSTNVCYMYCRHCFRKRMVGYSSDEISQRLDESIEYIKAHKEINNVLISGGDSLALSNDMIKAYLEKLTAIDHIDFIRFGSRIPVVFPERIYNDQELLDILKHYNGIKKINIITQFNHLNEITPESKKACDALLNIGLNIRNQTVLLKGVNDNANTLADLLQKLPSIGVHPYYVFQCRPVKGVKNSFQVPFYEGLEIIKDAKKLLNGISKSFKYAMSHPRGKIEIVGMCEDKFIFKFHQNKYPEDAGKIFFKTVKKDAKWLDDSLDLI